ncbi:MAG: RNA helicase, partial [Ignavibacteria bacterium]|nr:RNA helicase [Ignavibacteria bacterium]
MFSSAGFDVNRLKMFIIEDTDDLLRLRFDTKLARISESMGKTQRIYFSENITERVDSFADRTMVEPLFFEMDDWEEEEETE